MKYQNRASTLRMMMETDAITDAGSHTHKNSLFKTNQPRWLKNAPMLMGETAIGVQVKKYRSWTTAG